MFYYKHRLAEEAKKYAPAPEPTVVMEGKDVVVGKIRFGWYDSKSFKGWTIDTPLGRLGVVEQSMQKNTTSSWGPTHKVYETYGNGESEKLVLNLYTSKFPPSSAQDGGVKNLVYGGGPSVALKMVAQWVMQNYPAWVQESVEVTEAMARVQLNPAKQIGYTMTDVGSQKVVGKYRFTQFTDGSIKGWLISVQGMGEVGFITQPAKPNTKVSIAPHQVFFHMPFQGAGSPSLMAAFFPSNETRLLNSKEGRFAPRQLLNAVSMWMDRYGYEKIEHAKKEEFAGGDPLTEGSFENAANIVMRHVHANGYRPSRWVLNGAILRMTWDHDTGGEATKLAKSIAPALAKVGIPASAIRSSQRHVPAEGNHPEQHLGFVTVDLMKGNLKTESVGAARGKTIAESDKYMSTKDIAAEIRKDLKTAFPRHRFSVRFSSYSGGSSITVGLASGPDAFHVESDGTVKYVQINRYHSTFYSNPKFIDAVVKIVTKRHWDESDSQTDYFNTNFYIHLEQGRFDKPFVLTDASGKKPVNPAQKVPTAEETEAEDAITEGSKKPLPLVHFKSYTAAVSYAREMAQMRGYEIDEDSWSSKITHGYPARPAEGNTTMKKIDLLKGGKPVKEQLYISVYGMATGFELTTYITK